jgi:YD repeat-containing protein
LRSSSKWIVARKPRHARDVHASDREFCRPSGRCVEMTLRIGVALAVASCGAPMVEPVVTNRGRPAAAPPARDACPSGTLDGWQHAMWPACPALPFRYDIDVCNGGPCPQPCRVEIDTKMPDRPGHASADVTYDARGRMIAMTPLAGEYVDDSHCTYDGDRMTACGSDHLRYDEHGRIVSVVDPTDTLYGPRVFTYDNHGHVRAQVISRPHDDPDRTDFRYDPSGRLIGLDYFASGIHDHTSYRYGTDNRLVATDNGYATLRYSYDARGRIARKNDGRGEVTFTYDDRDRLVREVNVGDPREPPIIHTYVYDCR